MPVYIEPLGGCYFEIKQNEQNFGLLSTNKQMLHSLAAGEAARVIFPVQPAWIKHIASVWLPVKPHRPFAGGRSVRFMVLYG